jgi:Flp pilus assembly protein TadG
MAMVEFGLMLPVLITFFYGCIELTRYILIAQKVEKFAYSVADVSSQNKTLSVADITALLSASNDVMQPFIFSNYGKVFITSLYRPDGQAAKVNWRYADASTLAVTSKLGAINATPVMPGTFTFDNKENVIAAEIYYQFTPLLTSQFFGTTTIYRAAFYKPRLGSLTTAPI